MNFHNEVKCTKVSVIFVDKIVSRRIITEMPTAQNILLMNSIFVNMDEDTTLALKLIMLM